MKNNKKTFEVRENESISDCMDRMQKEGYQPIRRMEKPIFQEQLENGEVTYEPVGRQIVFEAKKVD